MMNARNQNLVGVIVCVVLVLTDTNATAAYIQIGVSAEDPTDGAFGASDPYGSTSVIHTYTDPSVTPSYDAGLDFLLTDGLAIYPSIDTNHVFVIYSPLGDSPAITNVDYNYVPEFQVGDTYTQHISLRDGVGIGAYVDLSINLLDLAPSDGITYALSMDTDGDRSFDSFASGKLADIGEGGSLWNGNVYVSKGVDVRDASTSTGYSEHFGELTLTVHAIPEPSSIMLLLLAGTCATVHLARRYHSPSRR